MGDIITVGGGEGLNCYSYRAVSINRYGGVLKETKDAYK